MNGCVYAQVPFCHNGCWECCHQLMWRSAVEKGIVPQLRQMLLLLSAFAFNLFFKLLEYPIYSLRLSELIFELLPLKKKFLFLFTLKGKAQKQNGDIPATHLSNITCIFLCVGEFWYSEVWAPPLLISPSYSKTSKWWKYWKPRFQTIKPKILIAPEWKFKWKNDWCDLLEKTYYFGVVGTAETLMVVQWHYRVIILLAQSVFGRAQKLARAVHKSTAKFNCVLSSSYSWNQFNSVRVDLTCHCHFFVCISWHVLVEN